METTQQASEPPIKAPDFGEPWHSGGEYVYSRDDKQVHLYPMRLRIAQCVNACAGMADPAREIQAMRDAMQNAANAFTIILGSFDEEELWITRELPRKALEKLQPFLSKP